MEPAQLQLVVNVIAITGVSSLASFCYLLKKENRKLASGLKAEHHQKRSEHTITVLPSPQPVSPATRAVNTTAQDIREFAAHRRTGWVKGLSSAMS